MAGFLGRVRRHIDQHRTDPRQADPTVHRRAARRGRATRNHLLKSHSNSAGFDPAFAHILIEATAVDRRLAG